MADWQKRHVSRISVVVAGLALIACVAAFAYFATRGLVDTMDAQPDPREQALPRPTGTITEEQFELVRCGMTYQAVKQALGGVRADYGTGMVNADLYLQGHRFEYDHCAWLLEGQMVKSVYGLFFHNILVAKGGPEAEEDPLCVDCALAIRDGSRDLSAGIPALEGGRCPDCGGTAGFDPHLKQLLPGSQRVWPVNEPYPYLP